MGNKKKTRKPLSTGEKIIFRAYYYAIAMLIVGLILIAVTK